MRRPYPLTIISTRYGGTYERGQFAAFNIDHDLIPSDVLGDDISCSSWFGTYGRWIGVGDTPQEAYDNLIALDEPLQMIWDREKQIHYPDHKPWFKGK